PAPQPTVLVPGHIHRQIISNARLPTLRVFTCPVGRRWLVVHDVAVLGVALQGPADAMGDVAEVAEQRALVRLVDVAGEPAVAAAGFEEVADVADVAARAVDLAQLLAGLVEDLVAV